MGDIVTDVFRGAGLDTMWSGFTGKPTSEQREDSINTANAATQWLTNMSQDYYGRTAPLRNQLITRLQNFMTGNLDPTASPMYAPVKMNAERQFQTAKENVLSTLPKGGALYDTLAELESSKAASISTMLSQIIQDEYNKAFSMGQGSQSTAAAGVGQAGQNGVGLVNALANLSQSGASGTGNLINFWASANQSQNASDANDASFLRALMGNG